MAARCAVARNAAAGRAGAGDAADGDQERRDGARHGGGTVRLSRGLDACVVSLLARDVWDGLTDAPRDRKCRRGYRQPCGRGAGERGPMASGHEGFWFF